MDSCRAGSRRNLKNIHYHELQIMTNVFKNNRQTVAGLSASGFAEENNPLYAPKRNIAMQSLSTVGLVLKFS